MNAITFILGILFVVSGIGKLISFQGFIETIISITHFSSAVGFVMGACITGFEIGGGIALMLRYRIKLFVALFSILVGIFIIVLTMAVAGNKTIACHCFGIFDIGLSTYQELVFDVLLLDVMIFYGMFISSKSQVLFQSKFLMVIVALLVLYAEYTIVQPLSKRQIAAGNINIAETVAFVNQQLPDYASVNNKVHILFLLDYNDFSCPPCFDSFLSLALSLREQRTPEGRYRAVGIMREDELMNRLAPQRLNHWKEINDITIPLVIASDTIFGKLYTGKSAVVILDSDSHIRFMNTFPLSHEQIKTALILME